MITLAHDVGSVKRGDLWEKKKQKRRCFYLNLCMASLLVMNEELILPREKNNPLWSRNDCKRRKRIQLSVTTVSLLLVTRAVKLGFLTTELCQDHLPTILSAFLIMVHNRADVQRAHICTGPVILQAHNTHTHPPPFPFLIYYTHMGTHKTDKMLRFQGHLLFSWQTSNDSHRFSTKITFFWRCSSKRMEIVVDKNK